MNGPDRETVADGAPPAGDWTQFAGGSGDEGRVTAARAGRARVVLVGLAAGRIALAETLASAGVGTVVLVDPGTGEPGPARDDLGRRWAGTRFELPGQPLTASSAPALVAGADLVVVCTGGASSPVHHWLNKATLRGRPPTLHATVSGVSAELGPLVVGGTPPCYLCWRMRAVACADDFDTAMAREEHPPAGPPAVLPHLPAWVTGLLAHEVLAVLLRVFEPRLAGAVRRLDGRSMSESVHRVLPRPDCPECGSPPHSDRAPPVLADLLAEPDREISFADVAAAVVSPVCGIVRSLEPAPRLADDPELPHVVQARLANALFEPGPASSAWSGAGRGPDLRSAVAGALSESLERYAALTWRPGRVVNGPRHELRGPSLDPRELVPAAPFDDSIALEWVPARSLGTGAQVWVPLAAAHLGRRPADGADLFRPTTSGFAAGSSRGKALLHATLEVIERDAFLLAWAYRWPGRRSAAAEVPDAATRALVAAYARRGVRFDVHRLPGDTVPVVLAAAWSPRAPRVVVGLGADLDPVVAARRAVFEAAQLRISLRPWLSEPVARARLGYLLADRDRMRLPLDHSLLYADPATADAELAHLTAAPFEPWQSEPAPVKDTQGLVERLVAVAGDVLYLDVTPADVAGQGLHVARVIVPGFQPLRFGPRLRHGGSRLAAAPALFGVGAGAGLNPAPHPLG